MSTNPIVANAITRSTIEQMQKQARINQNKDNSAVRNREEGVGKLTETQKAAMRIWRNESWGHAVFGLETRVRIKGAV